MRLEDLAPSQAGYRMDSYLKAYREYPDLIDIAVTMARQEHKQRVGCKNLIHALLIVQWSKIKPISSNAGHHFEF